MGKHRIGHVNPSMVGNPIYKNSSPYSSGTQITDYSNLTLGGQNLPSTLSTASAIVSPNIQLVNNSSNTSKPSLFGN